MELDLRDILEVPGGSIPFDFELDADNLGFIQVEEYTRPPHAFGQVRNAAGVITIKGEVSAGMNCVCDRCGRLFPAEKTVALNAIAISEEDPENPDAYSLRGDRLDISEVAETVFALDMEQKCLCSEGCKGICPRCGKDLNEGPCSCGKEKDPRLAVLEQLLDNKD